MDIVSDERTPRPVRLASLLRPIAFHPSFVDICDGSITAALMLSQILYWTPKTGAESNGWFYKSRNQWFEELRLTRSQQETARKILRDKGFIEEEKRSNADGLVMFFRANILEIEASLGPWVWQESSQGGRQESSLPVGRIPTKGSAGNQPSNKEREITSETTTFNLSPPASEPTKIPKKTDERHSIFRKTLEKFWTHQNPSTPVPNWGAADAGQLGKFLKDWPTIDKATFTQWLRNYDGSEEINTTLRPYQLLPRLHEYAQGPLNKFRKPLEENRASA